MRRRSTALILTFGAVSLAAWAVGAAAGPQELSVADRAEIHAALDEARLTAIPIDGGHLARNPGQRWSTRFDGRGFTTTPDAGGWTWGLELVRYGRAGAQIDVAAPSAVSANDRRVAYAWDGRLTEWYVNGRDGLEHGYTVEARPDSGDGPLTLTLAVRGGLAPVVSRDGRDVRFVDDDVQTVVTYRGLLVLDENGASVPARFVREGATLRLRVDDRDARYPLTIDPLAQRAYLKASNAETEDAFGISLAISGNTVVVGAFQEDGGAPGVNGDGSDNSLGGAGAAYVFVRSPTTWIQQAYLKASNPDTGDWFGLSVAIDGDTIVVGAPREDSSATGVNGNQNSDGTSAAGAAYVFVRIGGVWSQQAYLKPSNTDANDRYGQSVTVSGDTVVVGAYYEDSNATGVGGYQGDDLATSDSGAAYVYVRAGTAWAQQAYLKASNTGHGDNFGDKVSLDGDTLVVGARSEDSAATGVDGNQLDDSAPAAGAAYVFVRNGGAWSQQAYLKASNTGFLDYFGAAVSVSGDTVAVGARLEDGAASSDGAVYVFVRSLGTWSQQAYLKASNAGGYDEFGDAVAVDGDTLVAGAHFEGSGATGVNGDGSDNATAHAGAAYVFTRSGGVWTEQAYLKASNTGAGDQFGCAVGISGARVAVGAYSESSAATTVNGDTSDDSAPGAGAAYVFEVCGATASATPYGGGKPGSTGIPVLSSTHPPVMHTIADLTITGGLPGAWPVYLFAGPESAAIPFDDGTLLVNTVYFLTLPPLDGSGALTLDIPVPGWVCGLPYYFQAMVVDPGATGFYQTAQTNGLAWTVGG